MTIVRLMYADFNCRWRLSWVRHLRFVDVLFPAEQPYAPAAIIATRHCFGPVNGDRPDVTVPAPARASCLPEEEI